MEAILWKISEKAKRWLLFAVVTAIGLSFALYTEHAWEDWFITYRASKNLAMGNGLVFTVGEKVHSFTSPLGTLIPAALSLVVANESDAAVLWLFRVLNCILLGLSAVLLLRMARYLKMASFPAFLMIGLFSIAANIIDFSINGMETALMMIFLVSTIYVLSVPTEKAGLKLSLAWGGLMWTRPDSFVYIGALALGYLFFCPIAGNTRSRHEMLKMFALSGLLTAAVYLPWIIWTWCYYGTPIPHTIIAKGLLDNKINSGLISQFFSFPLRTLFELTSVISTFLPPYFSLGGWPDGLINGFGIVALLCTYYWCLPFALPVGRAVSFAVLIAHFYLTSMTPYFYPWYLPSVTLLSVVVLGQMLQQVTTVRSGNAENVTRYFRPVFRLCAFAVLVGSCVMTMATAYEMKLQQQIVENGNRIPIGLWLKEHAATRKDTVFLECLGYIGFYSQLKMLDFPGLSSPEVVAARRKLNTNEFGPLITALQPDWLVLRPSEIERVQNATPELLTSAYRVEKIFDVSNTVASYSVIPGREYLRVDQTFVVFKKIALRENKNQAISN